MARSLKHALNTLLFSGVLIASGCDVVSFLGGDDGIYAGGELFGSSIALDAGRAVVGAFGSDEAFVLRREGTGWETEALLEPPEGLPKDERGADVIYSDAVDIEGSVAVVGAPELGLVGAQDPGRAFVFERANGEWTRTAELRAADPSIARLYGQSVAVSSGRVAVVEAVAVDPPTGVLVDSAAVVFYERSGGGWAETSRIEETEYERHSGRSGSSLFGLGLALDGDRVAIGSPGQSVDGNAGAGVVRVYERMGAAWALSATLSAPSLRADDFMGELVAFDGSIIAAVARGRSLDGRLGVGSAFVYREHGTEWAVEGELRPADLTLRDLYGRSIAASGDRVAVGAIGRAQSRGSVFVWVRLPSGTWELEAELWPEGLGRNSSFGESVALEGDHLLAGANNASSGKGRVYSFRRGRDGWVQGGD
ncbi:hypothetical protein [Rubrivirga sp.]|uniref:hypothetical protein n=1 Tax=Rubrivirga sp. TaxID=1885344 RepID=UPI003C726864